MFGKLIKNEFKSNIHTLGMIYVVAVVLIGLMALSYVFKINWISVVATALLIATAFIAIVVTFFLIIVNFQKSLYGNQGYLSFTLPVTSTQLLASKMLVAFCWMLISFVVALGVFIGVYLYATAMVGDDVKAALQMLRLFSDAIPSKEIVIKIIVLLIVYLFVWILFLVAGLFFAITFSNTRVMQKMGAFSIVLMFFVVFIAATVISAILTKNVPVSLIISPTDISFSTNIGMDVETENALVFGVTGLIFKIVAGIGLFFGTTALMNSKVNIK